MAEHDTQHDTQHGTQHGIAAAIAAYQKALPAGELVEFSTAPFDRLNLPCRTATFFATDGRTRGGAGYGFTDDQALVGALGEMTEEFAASRAVLEHPRRAGSYAEMVRRHGPDGVADPRTLCLDAGSSYTPDRPLEWAPTRRWATGEEVWVPVEFVATYRGDVGAGPLVTPVTNGLGAGLTGEQAVAHGLLELLQRDGNGLAIRALATGVALDPATITDLPARGVLELLDAAGVDVAVKVASTDFGLPGFYVVGADRAEVAGAAPIMAAGGGEAVHPDRNIALRKALLEFCAARARMAFFHGPLDRVARVAPPGYLDRMLPGVRPEAQEPRALREMIGWLGLTGAGLREKLSRRVLRVDRRVAFTDLPTSDSAPDGGRAALLADVAGRLGAASLDILVADHSEFAGGVHAVKVIVPGLEVETMSYGRIGERNVRRLVALAEGGGPRLAGVGPAPPGARPVALTPEAEERLGGPAWLDWAAVERAVGDLYPIYREPGRHAAPLAMAQSRTR
jgi:ribosomal protein S12 methylthiotransferase accessory factor